MTISLSKIKLLVGLSYAIIVAYYGQSLGTLPFGIGIVVQLISGSPLTMLNGAIQLLVLTWLFISVFNYPKDYANEKLQFIVVSLVLIPNVILLASVIDEFPLTTSIFSGLTVLLFIASWIKYTIKII